METNGKRGFNKTVPASRNNLYAVPRIIALAERAGHLYAILYCTGLYELLSRTRHKNRTHTNPARRKANFRGRRDKVLYIPEQGARVKRKKQVKPARVADRRKRILAKRQGLPKKYPVIKSHKFQDIADYNSHGSLICFLSGEPIVRRKDITVEHYVPKSLVNKDSPNYAEMHAIVTSPYNLRPAIKVINNIKGNLLPCEWEQQKISRTYKALESYSLDSYERELLQRLLALWYRNPNPKKPCAKCALWLYHKCNGKVH